MIRLHSAIHVAWQDPDGSPPCMPLHDWAVLRENLGSGLENSHPHLAAPGGALLGRHPLPLMLVHLPRDLTSMDGNAEANETPSSSSILVYQDQGFAGSFTKNTSKTTSMSE